MCLSPQWGVWGCRGETARRAWSEMRVETGRQEDKAPHPLVGTARQQRAVGIFLIQLQMTGTEIQIHRQDVLHEMETFKDLRKWTRQKLVAGSLSIPVATVRRKEQRRPWFASRDRLQSFCCWVD